MVAGGMESMSNVPFYMNRDAPMYGGHTLQVLQNNKCDRIKERKREMS